MNEPVAFTGAGYFMGIHAPGKKGIGNFLPALHHAALCQSAGARMIRQLQPAAHIGTTYSCSLITPQSEIEADRLATRRLDALLNRLFIEPALGMGYPVADLPFLNRMEKHFKPGDDQLLPFDFDFTGIQNYTREVAAYSFFIPYIQARLVPANRRKVYHTQMNWEVFPESIYEMIRKFSSYPGVKKIYVTENGSSFHDKSVNGVIDDHERQSYLKTYLSQVLKAKRDGFRVEGYFVWSLSDNFEWAEGYRQRFGIVYVDYSNQMRTIKNSGYWYSDFLKS